MRIEWKLCLRLGVGAFLLYLAIHYWDGLVRWLGLLVSAAAPLLTGLAMAYIINIPMSFYERRFFVRSKSGRVRALRRPVCMLLAYLSVAAVAAVVLRIVVPEVGMCVSLLLAEVPPLLEEASELLSGTDLLSENVAQALDTIDWEGLFSGAADFLKNGAGAAANWVAAMAASLVSVTADLLIGFVFSLYLLVGKERLGRQLRTLAGRYLPRGLLERAGHVLSVADDSFHRYIVGQCAEAVILGVLCALGMLLLGFPYAAVVGATVGLTALIPIAGAYIGGAVGFVLILTQSPIRAVLFLVYLIVLQQLEGNLIYPRVVGSSMGLPGIWVLAAVILGGGLGGIPGMILCVPLTACVYRLVREDVRRTFS